MNKIKLITLAATLLLSMPSHALFGLGSDSDTKVDTDAAKSFASGLLEEATQQDESSIISALTSQLDVSTEQATGGAGALLALASNSLSSSESSELNNLIPGMSSLTSSATSLLGMADSMSAVTDIFNKLGLDASMITEYAPVLLEYLTEQGASTELLGSLSSLWS
ncbi:DUF2780 domain-containing protein [Vibrio sp. TH_r3]|uniref:DUF2780 domain-containing protein n=1 Tax=Vibrio sp. TH_r3 TaxID=3082084 RepID=UPI002955C0B5|nr:DUF2780 domain-containing protein [Vibrio sp. TH_r3]MDV7105653.1 DUF2780 domain-containing protein [Vibrio sp. TH_r3]